MKRIQLEQGLEDRIHPSSINDLRQLWKLHGSKALIQELARMDAESMIEITPEVVSEMVEMLEGWDRRFDPAVLRQFYDDASSRTANDAPPDGGLS